MHVVLVMFYANGERRGFALPRAITVLGRREDCDLRVPVGEVSRKHCRFIVDGDTLRIEDLGSSNGTFVNGSRVQEAVVQAGDRVQVGPAVFTIQIDGRPADDEIEPPTAGPARSADIPPQEATGAPAPTTDDDGFELLNATPADTGAGSGLVDLDNLDVETLPEDEEKKP